MRPRPIPSPPSCRHTCTLYEHDAIVVVPGQLRLSRSTGLSLMSLSSGFVEAANHQAKVAWGRSGQGGGHAGASSESKDPARQTLQYLGIEQHNDVRGLASVAVPNKCTKCHQLRRGHVCPAEAAERAALMQLVAENALAPVAMQLPQPAPPAAAPTAAAAAAPTPAAEPAFEPAFEDHAAAFEEPAFGAPDATDEAPAFEAPAFEAPAFEAPLHGMPAATFMRRDFPLPPPLPQLSPPPPQLERLEEMEALTALAAAHRAGHAAAAEHQEAAAAVDEAEGRPDEAASKSLVAQILRDNEEKFAAVEKQLREHAHNRLAEGNLLAAL
jgi:hypothetical protein